MEILSRSLELTPQNNLAIKEEIKKQYNLSDNEMYILINESKYTSRVLLFTKLMLIKYLDQIPIDERISATVNEVIHSIISVGELSQQIGIAENIILDILKNPSKIPAECKYNIYVHAIGICFFYRRICNSLKESNFFINHHITESEFKNEGLHMDLNCSEMIELGGGTTLLEKIQFYVSNLPCANQLLCQYAQKYYNDFDVSFSIMAKLCHLQESVIIDFIKNPVCTNYDLRLKIANILVLLNEVLCC